MGDISEHFNRSEYSCSCGCGFDAVDKELNEIMEKIRSNFGPVQVHCACRCLKHNQEVGSKDTSQHVRGLAADFHINDINNESIIYYANELLPNKGGIGIYDWGVHVDVRKTRARWDHREGRT